MVKKTTLDVRDAIKASNALLGEQASEEIANKTTDAVMLKNLCVMQVLDKIEGEGTRLGSTLTPRASSRLNHSGIG
jgi:hypothetical protein